MTHADRLLLRCLAGVVVVLTAVALPARPAGRTVPNSVEREQLRAVLTASIEREDRSSVANAAAAAKAGIKVRQWLQEHAAALDGIRRGPLGGQPWGLSAQHPGGAPDTPARVYLYVFDWHVSGKLVVYGLTGGVRKAYLLSDAAQTGLPATRVGSSTVFTVPKEPPDALATVVVLELTGDEPEVADIVAGPAREDGRIRMHARDAVVHGVTLRYEPEPHKDTIGYWTNASEWVSWNFEITEPGAYSLEILQGCGNGNGGSTVHFAVGGQVLPVTVQDTGGFQNFVARRVGEFTLGKPGRYVLSVKPVHKAGKAVMDLRAVTLMREK